MRNIGVAIGVIGGLIFCLTSNAAFWIAG